MDDVLDDENKNKVDIQSRWSSADGLEWGTSGSHDITPSAIIHDPEMYGGVPVPGCVTPELYVTGDWRTHVTAT